MTKEALITPTTKDTHINLTVDQVNSHQINYHHIFKNGKEQWILNFVCKKPDSTEQETYDLITSSPTELATEFIGWMDKIAKISDSNKIACGSIIDHIFELLPKPLIKEICASPPFNNPSLYPKSKRFKERRP